MQQQLQMHQEKRATIPATIRRPGAETKVGGSPLTTIGLKVGAPLLLWLRLCGVEAVEAQQSMGRRRRREGEE